MTIVISLLKNSIYTYMIRLDQENHWKTENHFYGSFGIYRTLKTKFCYTMHNYKFKNCGGYC